MAPEFVVATSAATIYPGGVIALRATDWMAGARGTLTSESDARAISGECVRDAQKVATSLFSDPTTAIQSADDTLEIDLSLLPIEDQMGYYVFVSLLIEGDWDVTDGDQLRGSTADTFGDGVCALAYSFDSGFVTVRRYCVARPRRRPHFLIAEFEANGGSWDITDTVYVRALSQDGSTVEYLIDQIFLMPRTGDGVTWDTDDFAIVIGSDSEPDDGADGGDDNGKFTAHYVPHETYTSSAEPTVGDYQRDPDDEFISQIDVPTHLLRNSETQAEVSAHAYSIHGADYREAATITLDDFSRTTGPDSWGNDDAGFQWNVGSSGGAATASWFTNGSQGVINTDTSNATVVTAQRGGSIVGAEASSADYTFSGIINYDDPTYDGSGAHSALIRLYMNSESVQRSWFVSIDLVAKEWQLWYANSRNHGGSANNGTQSHIWSSDVDISSWLAPGTPIGFRLEKRRYRWRIKIWDASGAEPGTWDMDVFLVSDNGGGTLANIKNYPYDDLLTYAHALRLQGPMFPAVTMIWGNTLEWSTYWDDIHIEYDPVGDGDDMVAWLEGPTAPAEQITIPYGAWQMVYWGTKDWTELDAGDPYVVMDAKVWNDTDAAELQRAQCLLWWFRSVHGGIVSMNWRSADRRAAANRMLVG